MPMHISPSFDTDPGRIAAMIPQSNPIKSSLLPATQSEILGILQREQDHAVALLSSSPLLASLFVSYANQAAVHEAVTPSTESEEWKALNNTISLMQDEIDKLKPENRKMMERLEAATASQEAFRSQVSALKEANTAQHNDAKSLRSELLEAKDKYARLMVDSDALQHLVSDLEAQRAELKETIAEQQIKISKFKRQGFGSCSDLRSPATAKETTGIGDPDDPEHQIVVNEPVKAREAKEFAEQLEREGWERSEREARERLEMHKIAEREAAKRVAAEKIARREAKERDDEVARIKAEKDAKWRAEKEVKEQAEREAREEAEKEEKLRAEHRIAEKERAKKEAKEKAEREAEEAKKLPASKIPSGWGSIVRENGDRSRKASILSQEEQKNEWAGAWDFGSVEKKKAPPASLPLIITSFVPGGSFDGERKI